MKYDITKPTAPTMPSLGKGTECFKLLLSQTSQDMNAPLLPMLSPILGTKISEAEFQYPSGQWFEMCGQQAALVADSAGNKGQLGMLVEARVGKGRLLMTTIDITGRLDARPVARQLRRAILNYMASDDFQPALEISPDVIGHFFTRRAPAVNMFTNDSPDELKPKLQ